MRNYISTLATKLNHKSVPVIGFSLLAMVAIPAVSLAYGPDRPTFTRENPANYVTFNSITNNAQYGDERNFMRVKESTASNTTYGDDANLAAGKEYEVLVFYHNNATPSLNASGAGVAKDAYARAEVPAIVKNGATETRAVSYVGASNAKPTSVYDHINFKNTTGTDIALRYVPGSAKITNNGKTNGSVLPDTLLSAGGVKLGFDSLNGTLPGCNEFAGYITFKVKADQPNFTFKKDVRVTGTKEWKDSVVARVGDKVDYRLAYTNTGTTEQRDVVVKDVLPKGLKYVAGTSKLQNKIFPNGTAQGDGINAGGVNIGNYAPTANAFFVFTAAVDSQACETLTNTASVETNNGNKQDTAEVVVQKDNCTPPATPVTPVTPTTLPTTGPVEIIAGLIGIGAITFGIVYYMKSRRELHEVLHAAQSSIPTIKK